MKSALLNCILIIDDDDVSNYLHKELLLQMNIAEKIEILSDGWEALNFLKDCTPALIFVDLRMPEMQGMEFVEKVNELPIKEKIKIIGISAHFSSAEVSQFKKIGVNALIQKPLTEEKVLASLD